MRSVLSSLLLLLVLLLRRRGPGGLNNGVVSDSCCCQQRANMGCARVLQRHVITWNTQITRVSRARGPVRLCALAGLPISSRSSLTDPGLSSPPSSSPWHPLHVRAWVCPPLSTSLLHPPLSPHAACATTYAGAVIRAAVLVHTACAANCRGASCTMMPGPVLHSMRGPSPLSCLNIQ